MENSMLLERNAMQIIQNRKEMNTLLTGYLNEVL